jgi:FkbM family methyltransferase
MILRLSPRFAGEGYEPKISRLVMRIRGRLAVDVGASLGQYTIPFASHFERVISVEPSPINLPILRQHLKRLKLENVQIVASAVGDFDGETQLYVNPENIHGGASIVVSGTPPQLQSQRADTSLPKYFRVPVVTLDTLLLHEGEVDLVKVDAESAEWQILRGAQESLEKIRRWMIELHDMRRMKEFDLLLKSSGYETKWVLDSGPSLHVLATRPGFADT